ncbi:GxxExxY protein [Tenacibaculum finnmarkense]|uniref:GxxExxY protein n=1 Tax=Tenacibaculum finnmarkense TaxID=2781243 RepID=UPI001E313136|nr:GxxExxY protein [Tenacibaculum finnmarkense]MCD8444643.1 GxxExxY protein [Tenacibaculum finnmarkense genomovar ulcerans]
MNENLLYKNEAYQIIGACMEVHKFLGKGFNEVVYGDALEIEFQSQNIPYKREVKFSINYKGKIIPHYYFADFVIDNKIILEIKAIKELNSGHLKQTLNYLATSKLKLGLLINFGENSLQYKRVILNNPCKSVKSASQKKSV